MTNADSAKALAQFDRRQADLALLRTDAKDRPIVDLGERVEHAGSPDQFEALQDELEAILRGAVIGLRDGTISKRRAGSVTNSCASRSACAAIT